MTIKTITENKKLYRHAYIDIKYNGHRKTYILYKKDTIYTTAGKKIYEFLNRTFKRDGNRLYMNKIRITIKYNTKDKTYTLYTDEDTKINGKINIEKILGLYGYDSIEEIEKDKTVNTKKELKKYLDEYFKDNKRSNIHIDDIPTDLSRNEFYAICRGFHAEQNIYYVIIDHDLRYITNER